MARRPTEVISHWHHYLEDFSTSALDFYSAVEETVQSRELPKVELSRVEFKEGGIGSAKREYLRIKRERVVFDLCAAPYGSRGYFFSYRLAELPRGPLRAPLGWLGHRLLRPTTYYRLDTALAFQKAVQAAVNEVLEGLLGQQGLRALSPVDKPSPPSWLAPSPPKYSPLREALPLVSPGARLGRSRPWVRARNSRPMPASE